MTARLLLLAVLLGSDMASAHAAEGKTAKAVDAMRPTGPVTVTADRAEFEEGGNMLYSGNVLLVSDTLKLSGEKLELQQFGGGQYQARVGGTPARLDHAATLNDKGEPVPAISAEAAKLTYDTRSGVIEINGHATMIRGKDEITGDNIRYNVLARRIEAAGGAGGQVRMVIQPPADKKNPAGRKPADVPPAAPAANAPASGGGELETP